MLPGGLKTSNTDQIPPHKGKATYKAGTMDTAAPQCQVQAVSAQYQINQSKGEKIQHAQMFCLHKLTGMFTFSLELEGTIALVSCRHSHHVNNWHLKMSQ